jgi:hypothetical protein
MEHHDAMTPAQGNWAARSPEKQEPRRVPPATAPDRGGYIALRGRPGLPDQLSILLRVGGAETCVLFGRLTQPLNLSRQ